MSYKQSASDPQRAKTIRSLRELQLYTKVCVIVCCQVSTGVYLTKMRDILLKHAQYRCYLGQKNGNMIGSPDKGEIRLFEVRIRGVGLYWYNFFGCDSACAYVIWTFGFTLDRVILGLLLRSRLGIFCLPVLLLNLQCWAGHFNLLFYMYIVYLPSL